MHEIDPRVVERANDFIEDTTKSLRGSLALKLMLEKGYTSTEEIKSYGYEHPPRAIGDVKDAGIPVISESGKSTTGKTIAFYRLGDPGDIKDGLFDGRTIFSKNFKQTLVETYGPRDGISGHTFSENLNLLQIDHRVPYRIAGNDAAFVDQTPENYMLLTAQTQRQKADACDKCPNANPSVCRSCYWASPEQYDHIATVRKQ